MGGGADSWQRALYARALLPDLSLGTSCAGKWPLLLTILVCVPYAACCVIFYATPEPPSL